MNLSFRYLQLLRGQKAADDRWAINDGNVYQHVGVFKVSVFRRAAKQARHALTVTVATSNIYRCAVFFHADGNSMRRTTFFLRHSQVIFQRNKKGRILFRPSGRGVPRLRTFNNIRHRRHRLIYLFFLVVVLVYRRQSFERGIDGQSVLHSFLTTCLTGLNGAFRRLLRIFLLTSSFRQTVLGRNASGTTLLRCYDNSFLNERLGVPFSGAKGGLPRVT